MLGVRQPSVNRYLKGQVLVPPVMQRLIDVTGGEVTANDFFIMPRRKRSSP